MIQRIQSLYLLLSVVASVVCLANPVGRFVVDMGESSTLYNLWLTNAVGGDVAHMLTPWVALFVLLAVVSACTLFNIFLYKTRGVQMRLLSYCMIVLVGYYIVGGIFVWQHGGSFHPTVYAGMPLVSLILDYLAFRGINQDDMLVKSLDRLR